MGERTINREYRDPIDLIWVRVLHDIGWSLRRGGDAYATWDGAGTLFIANNADLDPDDSLAQMILHELCHALVAGSEGQHRQDWGLCSETERDLISEHASQRLQAALAEPWGLREFMAVTTQWRPYWDGLPAAPLADGDDPAIPLAQRGHGLAQRAPFAEALRRGFSATARIADIVRPLAGPESLWSRTQARHVTGALAHDDLALRCADCAWKYLDEQGAARCQYPATSGALGPALAADESACERWEAAFADEECARCGACCRKGFDLVQVAPDDRFMARHPELVHISGLGPHLPRPGGRCPLLDGDGQTRDYRCIDYAFRPTSCEDFPVAGEACLIARRRVGLSR